MSEISVLTTVPALGRSERPLLSRVADSVYWMSRYVERAEHVARMLIVNGNLLTDVGDLGADVQDEIWLGVMRCMRLFGDPPGDDRMSARVVRHMAFDPLNPGSIASCIARARENARAVREIISIEMWESLNTLYWQTRVEDAAAEADPQEFLRTVLHGSMTFQGLTDQTLAHDQRWLFIQLGKHLERIDVTCRILETRFDLLTRAASQLDAPDRNIHWMGVLRLCSSLEAYRRQHLADFDPMKVLLFVTLEPAHPRSIRFNAQRALAAIGAIRAVTQPTGIDPAERVLGRLAAALEYAEPDEIVRQGFTNYMRSIESAIDEAAVAIRQAYFLQ
jgi:uncharacterized alpha-E superfamily protein